MVKPRKPSKTYYNGQKRRSKRAKEFKNRRKETPAEFLRRTGIAERKEVKRITRLLLDQNGAVCAICGKQIWNKKDLTLDHIKPLSKGGATVLENCQLACRECNEKKGNKY